MRLDEIKIPPPIGDDESLFLTLRDRFAMAALTGILSCAFKDIPEGEELDCATYFCKGAYEFADLMLAARQKEK